MSKFVLSQRWLRAGLATAVSALIYVNLHLHQYFQRLDQVESDHPWKIPKRSKREYHRVSGLNCDKYGGPSEEIAKEMVYWRDIPSDADFISPYAKFGPSPKYLTFEVDEGGWNNIRMSMETAVALSLITGRILVLPPAQDLDLASSDDKDDENSTQYSSFHDFFHLESIMEEYPAFQIISTKEFLESDAMAAKVAKAKEETNSSLSNHFPLDSTGQVDKEFWPWMREVLPVAEWHPSECVVGFPSLPGPRGVQNMTRYKTRRHQGSYFAHYFDNPTPVDAPPNERAKEIVADKRRLCIYKVVAQKARTIHFMGDTKSRARILTHFYSFLFLEDWRHDLWIKRFVRDHIRYVDEIQCAAARIVHAMRELARTHDHRNHHGHFHSFHIRRDDFQSAYKGTDVSAKQIYRQIQDVVPDNSTVFIATDERDLTFFTPLKEHYHLYFLKDFGHLISDLNPIYFGMVDQRVASRGDVFVGVFYSTFSGTCVRFCDVVVSSCLSDICTAFTGYINRMRGYHSQKEKLPGNEKGELKSYYYVPHTQKLAMLKYQSVHAPFWAREFPTAWRNIDHGLEDHEILS